MTDSRTSWWRSSVYEGSPTWLWFVGIARMGVLALAAVGAYRSTTHTQFDYVLLGLYVLALFTGLLYLITLKRAKTIPLLLTWTQMLVDFGVVAATVSFSGGVWSFFTFLLVIVILEAGLLLGLAQGFLFATMAVMFMFVQVASPAPAPVPLAADEWLDLWYRFLIQGMAFYLTAFVSGYWNQRITRMLQFQRGVLDNMNNGFLMTDEHGIIVILNRTGCEILHLAEGAAIGKPVDQILRVASNSECPVMTALRRQRDFMSYEFLAQTANNETKHLGLTTSLIYDRRQRINGIIASFSDLTDIVRMRQEIQSQDRLAAVGELATGLAHEIRNPVAAIRGSVEELRANVGSPKMVQRLAAIAIRESDHLNDIVSGFLDFARNPCLRREEFDLRKVLDETTEALRQDVASGSGHTIRKIWPDEPCLTSGSPSQIKQVFVNLAKNAVEAMEGPGTLTIAITPYPGSFEIRFDDEGPGIPPDKITRIFEPFYTDKERGVGMGLAVCSRIVTAHDGTIRAAAREQGGASMIVRLPSLSRPVDVIPAKAGIQ